MGKLHTHYDNLKVTRNAPPEVIRAAYKTLSQKYHPDRHPGKANADAVRVMTLINQSYQVLSDPAQRATHDRWIAQQEAAAQPTAARANAAPHPHPHPQPSSQQRSHDQSASVSPAEKPATAAKGGGLAAHILRHWLLYGIAGYYLANTLTGQLKGGQDYDQLKPAIGIHLLDFDLFEEPAQQQQAVWCFEMRDRWQPTVRLGRELQLNIIEMRKAERLGGIQPGLAAWLSFFEHWQEETTMTQIAYAPVQQALERLKDFSADEETRIQAFVRERALRDEISERRAERAKGEIEGRQKEAVNILQRLLRRRFGDLPEASSARLQAASLEQLEHWTDAVLDATSLSAVFASH